MSCGSGNGCGCNEKKKPCCETKPEVRCNPCTGTVNRPIDCPIKPKPPVTELVVVKQCCPKQNPCELPYQCCQRRRCCLPKCKTICYTCPPKREDGYPQDQRCYELAYNDAFDKFDIGTCQDNHWNFLTDGNEFIANDGKQEIRKNGLVCTAIPYTVTVPERGNGPVPEGNLDHYKFAAVLNSEFEVRQCGSIYLETCVSARVETGNWQELYADFVYNSNSDFRLAYASGAAMWDMENAYLWEIGLTNNIIFAGYYRTQSQQDEFGGGAGNYASFWAAQLIGRRGNCAPLMEFHKIGIAVDAYKKTVSYFIEGTKVLEFPNLGNAPDPSLIVIDYGGNNEIVVPCCVSVGFGTSNMLNATIPNFSSANKDPDFLYRGLAKLATATQFNPYTTGDDATQHQVIPFAVEEPTRDDRLFGEGAILIIRQLKVEYRY